MEPNLNSQFFKSTESVNSPATVRLTNKEMDIMKKQFERLVEEKDIQDIAGMRKKVIRQAVQLIITAKQDPKSGLKKDNYPAYALAAILRISREDDIFTRDWYLYDRNLLEDNINWIITGDGEDKGWWSLFQQAKSYIEKEIQVSTGESPKKIICSNQKSIQGWDIQKYNPSDLIHYREKGQTYCFLKSDVSFLQQGLNPFTGRKIRTKALKKFIRLAEEKKLFDPYGVTLPEGIKTKCPLFVSHDPLIGYYYHCEDSDKFVTKSVSPGQDPDSHCVGLLYQTTFRRPLSIEDMDQSGFIRADESNIISDELILDIKSLEVARPLANRVLKETSGKRYSVYNSMDDDTEHSSLRGSLQEFMSFGHIVLPSQAIQDILVQKIRPSEPITLFRGLSWNEWSGLTFEKWMNQIGRKKISIGDELEIIDTRVASWSANICISSTFALGDYGIVFSYQAQPEEIMLDTRMLLDREKFYQHDQAEVMLLPGRKKNGEWGGPITRRVKVEMVVWSWGQRTPSGFLLKEKPVEQYNLWVKELIIP